MTKKKTRKTKTKKRSKKNKCRRSVTKQYFGGLTGLGNQDNSVISPGIPTPSNSQIPDIVDKQNTSQYLPFGQQDMGQDLTLSQQNTSQNPQVSQQSMSSENTYQDPQLGQQNMNLISPVGQPGMAQGSPVGDEGMGLGLPVGDEDMGLGLPVGDEGMGLGSPVGDEGMGLGSPVGQQNMSQYPLVDQQNINNTNPGGDTPTESSNDYLDGTKKLENLENKINDKLGIDGEQIENIQDAIELSKDFQGLIENPLIQHLVEHADETIGEMEQQLIKGYFNLMMKFASAIPLFGSIPIAIQAVDDTVEGIGKIAKSINDFSESLKTATDALEVTNGEGQGQKEHDEPSYIAQQPPPQKNDLDYHDEQQFKWRRFTGGAMHRIGGSIHNFLESSKLSSKW